MKKITITLAILFLVTNSYANTLFDTYRVKQSGNLKILSEKFKIDYKILSSLNPNLVDKKLSKDTIVKLPYGWANLLKKAYPNSKIFWNNFNIDISDDIEISETVIKPQNNDNNSSLIKFSEFLNLDLTSLKFQDAKFEGKPIKLYMEQNKLIIKSKDEIKDCKYQRFLDGFHYCLVKKD